MTPREDTIIALATPQGTSALAIIRLSGNDSIHLTAKLFRGKDLTQQKTHTVHWGTLQTPSKVLDEVLVTVFHEGRSFTRENSVEISCHGSPLIVKEIIQAFLHQGARLAQPGEFTQRAFLNGRFDLAQAEAVADLIHAETDNARQAALNQMRGGFSKEIQRLREELIHFASLIELELDFGEEDVEFAKRSDLRQLMEQLLGYLERLIRSFQQGRVIKDGIPTVIAGKPNAGKSTLLNALLNEERAIVSDIPGTTRDAIEDEMTLGGIRFRFIDTAGLRETTDAIEAMGIERTHTHLRKASLILYVFDLSNTTPAAMEAEEAQVKKLNIPYLKIGNKADKALADNLTWAQAHEALVISASHPAAVDMLQKTILARFALPDVKPGDVVVTNVRHVQQLQETSEALTRALRGLDTGTTGDLLAMDIRQALYHLGEITGTITTDDLLDNIFSKFCIGK
ncbi:MAG: tRNA uridine-5-carboxymethylaminomethyl(34) synthesis GTPase MnmE [Cyclobacteriaceae bacterium]|nr:tRNA uridine-5-carboxymethylaminomethyl(34) synthesis GTPase MnmE [Cyclobacteriaceae bacterium]